MAGFDPSDPRAAGPELTGGAILPPSHSSSFSFLAPPRGTGELGRIGDYRVIRVLGTGGMGVVFEAEDTTLHRAVALKVLRPELAADDDSRERFTREARAAAGIRSEHVVTIYHVGEAAVVPYLAMEFLNGESLQDRLTRVGRLELRTALTIARQAASGLAAAHAHGLIHRDIKPANLWFESDTPGGPLKRIRILDFGLVRKSEGETSLTATGFIVGTPNFMAPEQAAGNELDHRADIFSLGGVLYTMLTGELPFPGDSAMAVMMALATKQPPRVHEKNPAVPIAVSDLVAQMLAKRPEDRPQTAMLVIDAIDAVLSGLPTGLQSVVRPPVPEPSLHVLPPPARDSAETVSPVASDTSRAVRPQQQPATARGPSRRTVLRAAGGAAVVGGLATAGWFGFRGSRGGAPVGAGEPIKVGVLHSRTGSMGVSEEPVVEATVLAIDEVNQAGGVLGRPLEPVIADGRSNPEVFAAEAERLLRQEKVAVIFGCWTSASRKAVIPVLDAHRGALFYPVQCEGLEQASRVVYLGPAPNQQLIPALDFLTGPLAEGKLGRKRIFFVGSDYVFPRAALEIIKDHARALAEGKDRVKVEVIQDFFAPLGAGPDAFAGVAAKFNREPRPDAIFNALNGSGNFHFFSQLRDARLDLDQIPILSVSISEVEARGFDRNKTVLGYVVASYFQSVNTPESQAFARKVAERYKGRVVSDMMAAAYEGVHLWAMAAEKAKSADPTATLAAVRELKFDGPRGRVWVDLKTGYTHLPVRIGKVRADGMIDVIPGLGSEEPLAPVPYPPTRTPQAWEGFLTGLQGKWNGRWQAPNEN